MPWSQSIICSFIVSLILSSCLLAQDEPTSESDLQVSTGFGLGPDGIKQFTQANLVNELGMQYDIMSLVNDPRVRSEIGLADSQFAEMQEIKTELDDEINQSLMSLIFDENKDKFEERFEEVETRLYSYLELDQIERLEQVKNQIAIHRFGFDKYVNTRAFRQQLGLSEDDLKTIGNPQSSEAQKRDLIREANQKLVMTFDGDIIDLLKSQFEKWDAEFLPTHLFIGKHQKPHSKRVILSNSIAILRSNRSNLDLTEEQLEAITQLRRQKEIESIHESLAEILDNEQLLRFSALAVRSQVKRYGTVRGLANGVFSEMVGLTAEEQDQLYELGIELQNEMIETAAEKRVANILDAARDWPEAKQVKLQQLIGQRVGFDLGE